MTFWLLLYNDANISQTIWASELSLFSFKNASKFLQLFKSLKNIYTTVKILEELQQL